MTKHMEAPKQAAAEDCQSHNSDTCTSSEAAEYNSEMGKLPPIGVFWDIENCQVPRGKSALHLVMKIRSQFFVGHTEAEFICVCDTKKEIPDIIQELQDAQVTVAHMNAISKNAADEKLKQHMRRFAAVHTHPACVLLISGDVNFAPDLSDLRHRHNFHIILIHPPHVAAALLICANEHYSLDEFTSDVLSRSANKPLAGCNELLVEHLPLKSLGPINKRLTQLSANCGGKVLHIWDDCALIRFPNAEAALRARNRMEDADVFGNKIKVCVKETGNSKAGSKSPSPKHCGNQNNGSRNGGVDVGGSSRQGRQSRRRRCKSTGERRQAHNDSQERVASLDRLHHLSKGKKTQWKENMATRQYSRGAYPIGRGGPMKMPGGGGVGKRGHRMSNLHMPGVGSVTFTDEVEEVPALSVASAFLDSPPDQNRDEDKASPEQDDDQGRHAAARPLQQGRGILHLPHNQLYQAYEQPQRSRSSSRGSEADVMDGRMPVARGVGIFRKTPGACRPGGGHMMPLPPNAPVNPFRAMHSPTPSSYSSSSPVTVWDEDDLGVCSAPVQLIVSNLDYNISAREWKKILSAEFSQHVQVVSVHIQTQPDNTNIAYVRVSTIDEGRFAISQFHRKKIGYKRIHVALLNNDSAATHANAKFEVRAVLREVTGSSLPLFKFIELFEKRYHRSISVSELYRMKDTVQITEQGGTGRMVSLISTTPCSSDVDDISEPEIGDEVESPVCKLHCEEGSKMYIDALDANELPFVQVQLRTLAPQVHALLQSHEGNMPLISFPSCYAAECGQLEPVAEGGVPLEHLISCVPGVKVALCSSGIKKVQWADSKPPATIEFGRLCASPHMTQQLSQFCREVIDLLKNSPQCRMPFSKFIPSYHHHFGRQCRVADYGYTKLFELFEAIPHVVQIIGSGSRRFVTLSHRAQVKRFSSDLLRILKSQASKQINVMDFPIVYHKVIGKGFDITDYGVCYIEDMLSEIPETTVVVSGVGKDMIMAIPRREQTREEMERMKQFALEVVDLLRHSPRCRMPFSKFIPSYHHHFGKQCRVADYGFSKLIELFEAIPHVVKIMEEHDEKMLCLTRIELLLVLEDQVSQLLQSTPDLELPVPEFLTAFMRFHGHSIHLQDYEVSSVTELISKIPNIANVENRSGRLVIVLVDHSRVQQLAQRVLLILMDQVDGSMTIGQLANQFEIHFEQTLDVDSLVADLQGIIQVSGKSDSSVVKLCPLQQFARDVRSLMSTLGGRLPLSQFEEAYARHFGVSLVPASYGQPSVVALLQAIPNMVMIRGKAFHRIVLLLQDMQGEPIYHEEFDRESPADFETTLPSVSGEDSGINSTNDYFQDEEDMDLMRFNSRAVSPYVYDLMGGSVPSSIPSPELCPMELPMPHHDLISFTPSPHQDLQDESCMENLFRTPDFLMSPHPVPSPIEIQMGHANYNSSRGQMGHANFTPSRGQISHASYTPPSMGQMGHTSCTPSRGQMAHINTPASGPQCQSSSLGFIGERGHPSTEFSESRFMMSYKNQAGGEGGWLELDAEDVAAMSNLNAEAPVWTHFQYCDWSVKPPATQAAPPMSELLKRAQLGAQSAPHAWAKGKVQSTPVAQHVEEGPEEMRALSPLQLAGEQLRQQLLKTTISADSPSENDNNEVEQGGTEQSCESPSKTGCSSASGSPSMASARKSRIAARFSLSPKSVDNTDGH